MSHRFQNQSSKIIWFLIGNPIVTASSRIHGKAIHLELQRLGYNSYIAYLPEFIEEQIPFDFLRQRQFESSVKSGDIVVLQKLKNQVNLPLLRYFKQLGLRLVLVDCDWPSAEEVAKFADRIICTSQVLRENYTQLGFPASFIEDCPELYFEQPQKSKREKFECYWFGDGSGQRWNEVLWLTELMKDFRLTNWTLKTISNHPQASIPWTPEYLNQLKQADVIVVPIPVQSDAANAKSANRLLQSMALSVPVICSPLPSYSAVVTSGEDAFVCSSKEEWISAFQELEKEDVRQRMGNAAFVTSQKFNINKAIGLWINELDLNEKFRCADQKEREEAQNQLSDFFYHTLVIKNPNYARKMRLSLGNMVLAGYSVFLKIKNRIRKVAVKS